MRIFFPGLLLLVALAVFVICAGILIQEVPYAYLLHRRGVLIRIEYYPFIIHASGVLLLATWAASWAWERIRRERMGRVD